MKFLTFTGMSRSGNHGVIRWLVAHYEEAGYGVYFYNNTVPLFLEHVNFIMPHVDRSVKKAFIVSFEDVQINQRFSKLTASADHNILLLRDPMNLFASRLMGLAPDRGLLLPEGTSDQHRTTASAATSKSLPLQVEKYKNHHAEFSGQTNFLKNKVCISYNSWVSEETYRRDIAESQLGLEFSDSKYKTRAGSSFGRPPASESEYFDRWKSFWDDPVYAAVRGDDFLMGISRGLGVRPGES
jgi:hypothetical protein